MRLGRCHSDSEPCESEKQFRYRSCDRHDLLQSQELEQENAFLKKAAAEPWLTFETSMPSGRVQRGRNRVRTKNRSGSLEVYDPFDGRVLEISESGYYASETASRVRVRKPMKSYWRRFVVYWSKVVGLMVHPALLRS